MTLQAPRHAGGVLVFLYFVLSEKERYMEIRGATNRHEAREIALQVLYAIEIGEHDPSYAFRDLVEGGEPKQVEFARRLVKLSHQYRNRMDELIAKKSERWDLNRMALVDHLVLRLALVELFNVEDVPPKVTINEAIEVSKAFSTDQSGRFINGILDAIFTENEQEIRKVKTKLPEKQKAPKKPNTNASEDE